MPGPLPPPTLDRIEKLHTEGYGKAEIARRVGVHANTVYRHLNQRQRPETVLSPEARRALTDFGYFRRRYFGRISTPWQEQAGERMAGLLASDQREFVVVNVGPGFGKALALDTPIPTPTGWTTIKDVQPGDTVYGSDGLPIRVAAKSEVFYDHDCYEVRTDDGASVTANAAHEWRVRLGGHGQYGSWKAKPDYQGKTGPKASPDGLHIHDTAYLARKRGKRPQLPVAGALDGPDTDLPIDPYTLGVWLGDGNSRGARFTSHPDDAPHIVARIQQAGYQVEQTGPMLYSVTGSAKWTRDGLATHLRAAGLLLNKHVPDAYMRASASQRLSLLQGLIDTDGYVAPNGAVEFCSTNRGLALSVQALVRSLGAKASLGEGRATIKGKDCGPKYRVTFYLLSAASLPRKADRTRNGVRTPHRYLTVTPVESVPTQCIQVDAPDGLFLAGEGLLVTHNSTLFTHDIPAWIAVRNRMVRCMIGSATQSTAKNYTRRLRSTFERDRINTANSDDLLTGRAYDPEATLVGDYGVFKPANNDMWRSDEFILAQPGGGTVEEKEPSFVAYGRDSGFLGGRFDLVIWDDLVTRKTMKTEDGHDELIRWFEDEAETRVEPGGLFILQGQRMSSNDLYRHALDMLGHDLDEFDEAEDPDREKPKKYTHIVYKAHYDDLCSEQHHTHTRRCRTDCPTPVAQPWPEGCLLDPRRMPWTEVKQLMDNRADKFQVLYQQEDIDVANALVKPIWIKGGLDPETRLEHPGCRDLDRTAGQIPELAGMRHSIVTIDPSPTRYFSIQWWIYHPESKRRFLIQHVRAKLDINEVLTRDEFTREFSGILVDWMEQSRGRAKITHVIFERNGAQQFWLDDPKTQEWARRNHVTLIPHTTSRNKSDEEYGTQLLSPLYQHGLIRLPYKGLAGMKTSEPLIAEVTRYPDAATTDCVMAQWFLEHNLHRIAVEAKVYRMARPSWLRSA